MKPIRQKQFLSSVTEPRREVLTVLKESDVTFYPCDAARVAEQNGVTAGYIHTEWEWNVYMSNKYWEATENITWTQHANVVKGTYTTCNLYENDGRSNSTKTLQNFVPVLFFFSFSTSDFSKSLSLLFNRGNGEERLTVDAFLDADLTTLSSYWLIISICWDGQQEFLPSLLCHSLLLFESRLFSTLHRRPTESLVWGSLFVSNMALVWLIVGGEKKINLERSCARFSDK